MPNILLAITHHNGCEYLSNPVTHETVISGTIQMNMRYASQVMQIRVQCLHQVVTDISKAFQGNTVTTELSQW